MWKQTRDTAKALGISPRQLRLLRSRGLFQLGREYRIITPPGAMRPTYQWNLKAIEKCLIKRLENR